MSDTISFVIYYKTCGRTLRGETDFFFFFFFGYASMFLSFASIFPLIWSLFNLEMLNTDFVWKGLCKSVCSCITVLQVNSSVQFYCCCCCWGSFCFCLHIFFILNFAFSLLGLYLSRCDYYWIPWKPQICVAEEMKHLIGTQKTCAVLRVHFLLFLQCANLLFLWKEINISATSAQAGCAMTELLVLSKNAMTVWTH